MPVSPTEEQLYTVLGDFLASFLSGVSIARMDNRVPEPAAPFVLMQIMNRHQLATNVSTYLDPFPDPDPGSRSVQTSVKMLVQFDFYGDDAGDNVQQFVSLWRDSYGCDALAPYAAPLYCEDGHQIPLVTGEEQYLQRWTVAAALQYNPLTSTAQQFAGAAAVTLLNVDVEYPP